MPVAEGSEEEDVVSLADADGLEAQGVEIKGEASERALCGCTNEDYLVVGDDWFSSLVGSRRCNRLSPARNATCTGPCSAEGAAGYHRVGRFEGLPSQHLLLYAL